MKKYLLLIACAAGLAGCSGHRQTDDTFSAHAESLNVLFMQFPGEDTQQRAMALVPEGAKIETINSTPKDITSVNGVLNRIIGVDKTTINGRIVTD